MVLNVTNDRSSITELTTLDDTREELIFDFWNCYYYGNSLFKRQNLGIFIGYGKLPLLF